MELSTGGWIGCAACIICAVCAALCTFFAGMTYAWSKQRRGMDAARPPKKKLFTSKADKQREEQARILQAEMANFMNYNGDRQSDPKEAVKRGR